MSAGTQIAVCEAHEQQSCLATAWQGECISVLHKRFTGTLANVKRAAIYVRHVIGWEQRRQCSIRGECAHRGGLTHVPA